MNTNSFAATVKTVFQGMPGSRTGRNSRTFGTQTSGRRRDIVEEKGVQVGTYPDITTRRESANMSAMSQQRSGGKGCFPQMDKSKGEVFLFMRGKKELVQRLKNAFIKEKRIIEGYGGEYIGISEDLKRYEGDMYRGLPEQCIILIKFSSMAKAERWTQSSNNFKQKDFPSPSDEIEMFAVPVSYLPCEADLTAFQLTEMYGLHVSPADFNERYAVPVSNLLNARRVYHGAVASHNVNRLRNCMIRPDTYILLNCADSECKLTDFYDSAEYQKFKAFRQQAVAETNTCFFSLKRLTST